MATYVPQRELRNNPGAVLGRVQRGEELTITIRGRPVADLVPTREHLGPRAPGWKEFAAGLHGLLTDDSHFAQDVREGLADEAADPFERWE